MVNPLSIPVVTRLSLPDRRAIGQHLSSPIASRFGAIILRIPLPSRARKGFPMYPNVPLFINGEWCNSNSGATIPVVNPASGDTIGTVAHASGADAIEPYLNSKFVSQAGI